MTRTDDLIAALATDTRPVRSPASYIALALTAGALFGLAGLILVLGSPLGPIAERGMIATAIKLSYGLTVALIAAIAALAAGRPGTRVTSRILLLGLPLVAVAGLALTDLAAAPRAAWTGMLFGTTFVRCMTAVTLGSVPAFLGLTLIFRWLAPTRLGLAGFLIGLGSGGAAAAAYGLYCPEGSPAFLLAAYTPAMLVPALAGALGGRWLLRW